MLGIDERALRFVWTVFLFGIALAIVYFIRDTLIVFALAIFFAYMLSPIVRLVERFTPARRPLALAAVYVVLIGIIAVLGFELVPKIADEATAFAKGLPTMLSANKLARFPLPSWLDPAREQIITFINNQSSEIGAKVGPLMKEVGTHVLSGLNVLLGVVLVPILGFFFLKDAGQIRKDIVGSVDDHQDRGLLNKILDDIHSVLKNYIRALVLICIISFTAWSLFLRVIGFPYELLLAGLAAVLEFIPVIGPAVAGIVILGVGLVSGSGVLWVILFWVVFRLFTDYMLNPYLMSSGVELHPLLVLFGVLAGGDLAGVPGMFFSIPVLAILRAVYLRFRDDYVTRQITAAAIPADAISSTNPRIAL